MLNVSFWLMSTTRERSATGDITSCNVGLWLHLHMPSAVFLLMRRECRRMDMNVRSGCLDKKLAR
ncbi:hypothetical protein Tco_1578603, partial [Tanacetum coccineum]